MNIELFFQKHPEHKEQENRIMEEAMEKANDQGFIGTPDLEKIMGNLADIFFLELKSPEQMAVAQQQIINPK